MKKRISTNVMLHSTEIKFTSVKTCYFLIRNITEGDLTDSGYFYSMETAKPYAGRVSFP